jgi:hypothetical protein
MEIKKEKTFGRPSIKFTDSMGDTCYIWIMDNLGELRFDLDTDFAQFSQEDIKSLLPYLQSFVETGELEPQQSPSVTSAMEHGDSLLQKYSELPQPRLIPTDPTLHVGRDALSILAMHRGRYSQQFAHEKERIQSGLIDGIINPDASQAADRLESKLEALKDLEDDLAQSPLQGGSVDETKLELDKANRGKKYYMRQCDKQVDEITRLEELLEEWNSLVEKVDIFTRDGIVGELQKLHEKTAQLLNESE